MLTRAAEQKLSYFLQLPATAAALRSKQSRRAAYKKKELSSRNCSRGWLQNCIRKDSRAEDSSRG